MLDKCANSECPMPFDHNQGRYFCFRRACAVNEAPANTHNVQHFWLCGQCAETYTLQCHKEHGLVISLRLMAPNGITTPSDMYHRLSVGPG